ncbi:MAG: hypothetical protein KAH34_19370 [Ketobacter sp.]|nr:hypothetical protein [Ketobacter sp.]
MVIRATALLVCLIAFAYASAVQAHSSNATKALVQSLGFVRGLGAESHPSVDIVLLSDPQGELSMKEAQDIEHYLHDHGQDKWAHLKLQRQRVTNLDAITRAKIIIVTRGLDPHHKAIADKARQLGALVMSTDVNCIAAGDCVLGADEANGVTIYLNETALRESGFDVDAAFRFMVIKLGGDSE